MSPYTPTASNPETVKHCSTATESRDVARVSG